MSVQEQTSYPLPVVHMNGTDKKMLLHGYTDILNAIHVLQDTIKQCEFHARDYYPLDDHGADHYQVAWNERYKHNKAINDFGDYIEEHIAHLIEQ